jgi:hypothetical protein
MPINASIPMGWKGINFDIPDPVNQFAKVQQIQAAQQANALNQMKMDEMRRASEEQNALRQFVSGADLTLPETRQQLATRFGKTGIEYATALSAQDKEARASQDAQLGLALKKMKARLAQTASQDLALKRLTFARESLVPVADQASYDMWRQRVATDLPGLVSHIPAEFTPENKQTLLMSADQIAKAALDANKPTVVSPGGSLVDRKGQVLYIAPTAPKERTPTLMTPEEEAQRIRIAAAGRAPEPVVQVIGPDGTPVYARRSNAEGMSVPQKPTGTGKTPTQTAKDEKTQQGKEELSSQIEDLLSSYQRLDEMRAIPSKDRGLLSNLSAAAGASAVGQIAGRAAGTAEQTERDFINGSKLRLLMAIKNATGMSAQQLNSNAELKAWLASVSDPGQSIETVRKTLDAIRRTYLTPSSGGATPATAAPQTGPKVGTVEGGYKFKGGNPADPKNWEKQ